MFMYVTFVVNAMRIFGNNRKIIVNNWTISQELWNRIIGKILSIIASGLEGREREGRSEGRERGRYRCVVSYHSLINCCCGQVLFHPPQIVFLGKGGKEGGRDIL